MLARRYDSSAQITSIHAHAVGPTQAPSSSDLNPTADIPRSLQPLCHKALRPQTTRRAHHLRSALPTQGAENGTSGSTRARLTAFANAFASSPTALTRVATC